MFTNPRNSLRLGSAKYSIRSNSNEIMPSSKRNQYRTSYLNWSRQSSRKRPKNLTNISVEYNNIKEVFNNPDSILNRSKAQSSHLKQVEYRKLYKRWCGYNKDNSLYQNLTIFHDHLTKLKNEVYPFNLIKDIEININAKKDLKLKKDFDTISIPETKKIARDQKKYNRLKLLRVKTFWK